MDRNGFFRWVWRFRGRPNEAGRLCRTFIDERGFMGLLENIALAFGVTSGLDVQPFTSDVLP